MSDEPYAARASGVLDRRQRLLAPRPRSEPPPHALAAPRPPAPPFYASWLNQIEIVFSVIQRKVLIPNDFPSLQAVVDRLDDFEHHYNQIAKPFQWSFTRRDLGELIARVSSHEPRLRLAA